MFKKFKLVGNTSGAIRSDALIPLYVPQYKEFFDTKEAF